MSKPGILLLGVLISLPVMAKNLGTYGPVFPIAEIDMLSWIDQRLKSFEVSGELAAMKKEFRQQVRERAIRPVPVEGLTTTLQPETFNVDPSLILKAAIKDHTGKVLYPKGMRINPFDTATWPQGTAMPGWSFNKELVFLDGDDPQQVAWFLQYQKNSTNPIKAVLVKGEPGTLARQWGGRFYFDQQGNLTRRLSIRHIPSVVRRSGIQWQVQEFDVSTVAPISKEAS